MLSVVFMAKNSLGAVIKVHPSKVEPIIAIGIRLLISSCRFIGIAYLWSNAHVW